MARSLHVPDLAIGADAGHLGLVPIDVARLQKPQSETGVGRSFVNVRPQAGLAILSPFKAKPVIDVARAESSLPGVSTRVPFDTGDRQ